jgi:hypothetical protein
MKKLTKRGEVLVMKCVGPNGESHGSFIWPTKVGAIVEAPDWSPAASCGNGLHGWLWGLGDLSAAGGRAKTDDAVWMALAVIEADVIDLGGKVKFPWCRIAAVGDKSTIANVIAAHRPDNTQTPMFAQAAAGSRGQAAAGSRGQAAAGEAGQAAAGEAGQAAAGYAGQAAAGEAGQAAAGSRGQAAAGSCGQAAAGSRGQAAAGYAGQAAAGEAGQAAVDADGLATCGIGGLVKGGANAVLVAMYLTGPTRSDFSYSAGQVGRAGIEAGVWYEGSADGLRRVTDDDARVKQWTAAWALFDKRRAAREALAAKADEAQAGTLAKTTNAAIKPTGAKL